MTTSRFIRRYIVYNKTQKKHTSMRVVALLLNIEISKFIDMCETEILKNGYVNYTDTTNGNEYNITILRLQED
jgi:hypothetical protein